MLLEHLLNILARLLCFESRMIATTAVARVSCHVAGDAGGRWDIGVQGYRLGRTRIRI